MEEGDTGGHSVIEKDHWNDDDVMAEEESWKVEKATTGEENWEKDDMVQQQNWHGDENMIEHEDWKEHSEHVLGMNDSEFGEVQQESNRMYQDNWRGEYSLEGDADLEKRRNYLIWPQKKISPGEIYTLNVGFGQRLRKMPREAWGAVKPLPRPILASPVSKVRLTQTGTASCQTTDECMRRCREIQKYYMDLGFSDIPFNFLVGGDGVLYHGRGWQKQADRPITYFRLRKSCIDVAYIGNFEKEPVPYQMLSVATDFIKYGLKVMKISPFYQVYSFLGERHASN